jgi:hypothetical protein
MRDDPDFADLAGLLRFDEPAPKPVSRGDSRLLTILRVGKLTLGRFEELCLIRHVGAGGVMAHVHLLLAPRQRVRIEFASDRKFWGTVLWIRDGLAGIGFDGQVDLEALLARDGGGSKDHRSAGPRLNIECSATLRVGGRIHGVRVHDLGQSGIGLLFPGIVQNGQDVVVTLEGFRPVQGSVIWCRNGRAGIAFNQAIAFDELTRWLLDRFGKAYVERQGGG